MSIDIQRVRDVRITEDQITEIRGHRMTNFSSWKDRIATVDRLYRGDWHVVFPDETSEKELPNVTNLVQVTLDDMSRLVSEAMPSIRVFPENDTEEAQKAAYLREAIAETYWEYNDGDLLIPRLAMDLTGTGGCFLVVTVQDDRYPRVHRVDPRMAYPDVFNGRLQDLLVVQVMKVRQAARLFPQLGLADLARPANAESAEVLEYYSADECVQAVILTRGGKPVKGGTYIVKRWYPDIGMPPVAFAQLDSFDGEFRGMFDQIAGSLNAKNRIVRYLLDYSDQLVYAPKASKGLLNPEERDGPMAHYRLDPNVPDARIERIPPAGNSPDLWRLLQYLDSAERAGTAYPAQRHGEVSQSIASAAFVNATMGQLTSTVRNIQRLIAIMRQRLNEICFRLDEKHLDHQKPLLRAVGRKKEYTPSKEIAGKYHTKVVYGAGAGLDRLNADVRILQHLGAGLISKETAREQIDYLPQDGEEKDRIERETTATALAQKFLAEAPWSLVAEVYIAMADGKPMVEAIREVMRKQQQVQPSPVPAPPQSGATPGVAGPMEEQLALQKGKVPEETPPELPALTDILVGR